MKLVRVLVALVLALASPLYFGSHVSAATSLSATLSGDNEVPASSGDSNGTGSANVTLKTRKKQVCWLITHDKIDAPTAGHIHQGVAGTEGSILVSLFSSTGLVSGAKSCVRAPRRVIQQIAANPSAFYVNLHNGAFPDGAIRGQLG